jgi:hypothetical protein
MENKYPQYVKMGHGRGSCLRLLRDSNGEYEYYIDCGGWEIDFTYRNDIMYSLSGLESINKKLLTPITEKEWRECNGDYAPENPEIFGYLIEETQTEQKDLKYLLIKKTK